MVKDQKIPFGYKVREITFNLIRFVVFFVLSKERKNILNTVCLVSLTD
jgi:hypothetical protein